MCCRDDHLVGVLRRLKPRLPIADAQFVDALALIKTPERQSQIVTGDLSGAPGPGYLAFLAAKGFTQAQFDASGCM